ncbi:biotin carboxyl carrier protein of acetyl-CoA carboxylase-like [Juglans microcarpa x Juglans regia]|uniref:biotin carboxyl carrier protein of acetyl-CoA carboxylase-like n=1 Tax=Juglans microcarpa x Juglans regia TaxID=2249226 RepID=UPI001B7DF482|nr:biotin carboxyl carrier protein of acetyl-CoA carboxylase-like [Juglans microcarpa x Juglans regia]
MASCSLGTSNIRISVVNFNKARAGILKQFGIRTWTGQRTPQFAGVTLQVSQQSKNAQTVYCGPSLEKKSAGAGDNGSEATKFSGRTNPLVPNSYEVESLLTALCDTTSIAEFELKLDGFRLHVMRDLTGKIKPPPPPSPTPIDVIAATETPANGSVSALSLSILKPVPSSGRVHTFLEKAADEGLVILKSPKVGFFRRSRTIKGKRAPPSCKEKQIVKENQVLCFVEQLGGELPIESDVSGEVIKILREDGDPVGYGDALIAILPSFPGIKKLQ